MVKLKEGGMDGTGNSHGEMRNSYKILFQQHERKSSFEKSGRKWQENIKLDREL
jgi:hypothetical protein